MDDAVQNQRPPASTPRRRGLSLRTRLVLLTTGGLAIGLAVGGVVLVVMLRAGLDRATDDASAETAQEVVTLVNAGRLPDPIPAGGTTIVQVVDAQGRVLAASAGADRLVPALDPAELAAARSGPTGVPGSRFGVLGPVRVLARSAGPPDAASTVVVAAPSGDIDDAVRLVRTALIAGFAVLLALLAAVAWRLIGATLRPVEALRASAEKITGAGTTDTLPLPDAHDEIRRLAVTLNSMLDRVESSRRRQRAFVADAAHELRSPLTSLRTQLEVAAATGDEPDAVDLRAEVDRLTALVDDLLILARVDDAQAPSRELVDLPELAAAVTGPFAAERVSVTLEAARCPPVEANRSAVSRVLTNLLDNAVRHASTAVTVTVGPAPDGAVAVMISDDGPGIPEEDKERVFQRFVRLQDARDRDTGGSGLGLAIVRELLGQQGGSITLGDATPGADPPGLQVEVRLPAARARQPHGADR